MQLIKPRFKIMSIMSGNKSLILIEEAGRTCYKSEDKITENSAPKFVTNILRRGHESVIEHSAMTVRFVVDRGVTHELVRHRLCAFSQESTRYCNYKGGVTFVIPPWLPLIAGCYENMADYQTQTNQYGSCEYGEDIWFNQMLSAETEYIRLLTIGWSPQQARSVLPNSLKTEIVVTTNFREWRHIFSLRCSEAAHTQMREIVLPLRNKVRTMVPIIFDS
uniref:Putative thymidylate synthase n=1 Tax=viral metagenome TaxID=1070528 RepID=A0A6M3JLG7_9ZZZZ